MRGRVQVSQHAHDQARARFPAAFPGAHAQVCRRIVGEITAAVDAGRMAKNTPRWAVRAGTLTRGRADKGPPGSRQSSSLRFVWTEDQRRVYLIRRGDPGRWPTVVVTCIRPDVAESVAA